jgi:hypothetical protein
MSVPCDFHTPISITVGGKVIDISATFNYGPFKNDLTTCVAGVVSDFQLTGCTLAR